MVFTMCLSNVTTEAHKRLTVKHIHLMLSVEA